jgi:hypothetical protein
MVPPRLARYSAGGSDAGGKSISYQLASERELASPTWPRGHSTGGGDAAAHS